MSAARQRIDPALFTVVVTSCGRFDLLARMIDSFARHFDADRIIVAEDSGDHDGARAFAARSHHVELRINDPKLGQMRSIDRLYETIATPYVIHLEDDWEFTGAVAPERIAAMLEARPDISGALLAHREYATHYDRGAQIFSHEGLGYKTLAFAAHPTWFSYSFNPSVARLDLWRRVGPFADFGTEEKLSAALKEEGARAALLWPPVGRHIGDDRHVPDPFQPQRPRNMLERLARSLRKRLAGLKNMTGAKKS